MLRDLFFLSQYGTFFDGYLCVRQDGYLLYITKINMQDISTNAQMLLVQNGLSVNDIQWNLNDYDNRMQSSSQKIVNTLFLTENNMKLTIILLSAIFCLFLYRLLYLYTSSGTSLYFSIALFLWILAWMITPIKDTHEFKELEIHEVWRDFEQEKRILKTRIASEKRKARKQLTK